MSGQPDIREPQVPRAPTAAPTAGTIAARSLPTTLTLPQVALVLAVISVVLVVRKPEALISPQLIADDALLFRDAWVEGLGALFNPYAGYLLFLPRLVAWLGVILVPVATIPIFYGLAALASMLFVCARLVSARITVPYAWLGAFVVPLVPHDGEVYLNLCYIQWSLVLAAFALPALRPPRTRWQLWGDLATITVVGLSGPFVLAIAPFLLHAALRERRSRYRWTMAGLALVTSVVQLVSIAVGGALASGADAQTLLGDGIVAIGTKLVAVTFLGRELPYDLPVWITTLFGVIIALLLARTLLATVTGRDRMLAAVFLFGILFYAASAVIRVQENPRNLVPFDHGDRYFYVPRILLVWTLMLALSGRSRRVAIVLLALIGLSAATTFRTDRPKHYDWRHWAPAIERGETTTITVSPYDWSVEIPGRHR